MSVDCFHQIELFANAYKKCILNRKLCVCIYNKILEALHRVWNDTHKEEEDA